MSRCSSGFLYKVVQKTNIVRGWKKAPLRAEITQNAVVWISTLFRLTTLPMIFLCPWIGSLFANTVSCALYLRHLLISEQTAHSAKHSNSAQHTAQPKYSSVHTCTHTRHTHTLLQSTHTRQISPFSSPQPTGSNFFVCSVIHLDISTAYALPVKSDEASHHETKHLS